jgi:hypothetical protein
MSDDHPASGAPTRRRYAAVVLCEVLVITALWLLGRLFQ